jgi:hypothetical protein
MLKKKPLLVLPTSGGAVAEDTPNLLKKHKALEDRFMIILILRDENGFQDGEEGLVSLTKTQLKVC